MSSWVSWGAFASSDPRLAISIRELLFQYGRGMGYLATIRRDGGPRLHPVSPVIAGDRLYCFVIASPKRRDLLRDGRYALHSFPGEQTDAEAYLSGNAREVVNLSIVDRLATQHRAAPGVDWTLFELSISFAMMHRSGPDSNPAIWRPAIRRPSPSPPRRRILVAV